MTRDEVMARLESLGDEKMKAIYAKSGSSKSHFGVKMGDLRTVAKEIKIDPDLSRELWQTGNMDAMLLSMLIIKPKQLDLGDLERMVLDITHPQVADWFSSYILKPHPQSEELRQKWMDSDHDWTARMGWNLTSDRIIKKSDVVDAASLLDRIETEMGDAPEPKKWAMNFALIYIGIHHPELRERAIAVGEKLGAYRDYPTPKGCTSPFAPIAIPAMVKNES